MYAYRAVNSFVRTPVPSSRKTEVVLSGSDRSLLQRCLNHQPNSWEKFVDRYLGLVVHVVNHTAQARSLDLSAQDKEDLCSEVFLGLLNNDLAILRAFRGECSLATYLTVVFSPHRPFANFSKQEGRTKTSASGELAGRLSTGRFGRSDNHRESHSGPRTNPAAIGRARRARCGSHSAIPPGRAQLSRD